MILNLLLLLTGLAMLVGGGERMVKGASVVARNLGVSPLVVGLTVVAFGTSAPELVVNVLAAWEGSGELSFGNILGSNIANIGLILAVAAILRPLRVSEVVVSREIPMMLLAALALAAMGADRSLRDLPRMYDRADGLLLLLFFSVFVYYTSAQLLRRRRGNAADQRVENSNARESQESTSSNVLWLVGGLVTILIGGRLTVSAAVALAQALNVSEVVIGITVVAVGTSLPELVTSVIGVLRGQTDLVVGNVVGSNIFNSLFVLGTSASIGSVPVPEDGAADMVVMLLFSATLLPFAISGKYRISRVEGGILLAAYIAYIAWRAS